VMEAASWHTFQVLTKRAERMQRLLQTRLRFASQACHIWWGVSVEDRKYGLPRIDHVRRTPAQVRFLSVEPLLEDLGQIDLSGIHWVIVGGESGPGARPLQKEWVESLQRQCARAVVPFFFKQWGGFNKKKKGRVLNGQTYDDVPQRALNRIPAADQRRALIAKFSDITVSQPR
jgi:protein gp37